MARAFQCCVADALVLIQSVPELVDTQMPRPHSAATKVRPSAEEVTGPPRGALVKAQVMPELVDVKMGPVAGAAASLPAGYNIRRGSS